MKLHLTRIAIAIMLLTGCNNNPMSDKFRGDNLNSGNYNAGTVVTEPVELWKFKTSSNINASPVFDGESIYIGSADHYFYSFEAKTGQLNWKYKTEGKIYSTAIINQNSVLFLSYDGFLYNLNRKTGELIWKFKTEGEEEHMIKNYYDLNDKVGDFWDFYQSSPAIDSNNIYFGCGELIYAVNLNSGEEKWRYKTEGAVHSSPAIKDNKIVIGSFDSRVYCLDSESGKEEWIYETGRDTTQYVWLGVQASPAISGDSVFIGSRDALIYCFSLNSGDTIWTNNNFNRSWMPSSFAIGDKLYCGSSDGFSFYAINKEDGEIDYTAKTHSYTFSSPAVSSNMAYIGSANGRLYAIDLKHEKIAWEYLTHGAKTDTINIYNDHGAMDAERFKVLAKKMELNNYSKLVDFYKLYFKSSGAIVSSPVIYDGIIYFTSMDGYIYAITNKNK